MIDQNALAKLRDLLRSEEEVLIFIKKDPDIDTMAAGTALYLALTKAGKKVSLLCPSSPLVEHSNLVGIDKVTKQAQTNGRDLTIVLPYQKGKIDKISYNIENDKIHLVVKAGSEGLGFEEKDITYLKTGGVSSGLVFMINVSSLVDLSGIFEEKDAQGKQIVSVANVDNSLASLNFTESLASVSELVAKILTEIGAPLDQDLAQNLLLGINVATDNFRSEQASPLAFEMAGVLMRYGARRDVETKEKVTEQRDKSFELKEDKQSLSSAEDKKEDEKKEEEPPLDWLTPKIYKGSTLP